MSGDLYVDRKDPTKFWKVLQFGLQNLYDANLDEWIVIDSSKPSAGKVTLPDECASAPVPATTPTTRAEIGGPATRGDRHQREVRARQDSNLGTRFRKPMLYPLSYGGSGPPTMVARRHGHEPLPEPLPHVRSRLGFRLRTGGVAAFGAGLSEAHRPGGPPPCPV